ncbi:MAG: hypothetical protein WDW36_007463 [Sanguina aurantia]
MPAPQMLSRTSVAGRAGQQVLQVQSSRCGARRWVCHAAPASSVAAAPLASVHQWLQGKADLSGVNVVDSLEATSSSMLVASKDFKQGDSIISVPDSAWFTPAALRTSNSLVGPHIADLEPWVQLTLLLIAERAKGSSSAWHSYVGGNSAAETPLLWEDSELSGLEGTQLLEQVIAYREYFSSRCSELQQDLFASQPAAFPPSVFTQAAFLSAAAAVRSSTHAPLEGEDIALVPLADQVRHARGGNSRYTARSVGLSFLGGGRTLNVEATRTLRKGEEVTIDYAPEKLDGSVMLDFGVLDAARPRPGYSLVLTMPATDRYYDDKIDILELNGLSASQAFTLLPEQQPPLDMMAFLRLMQLSGTDCFLLETIFRDNVWEQLVLPVSEANEGGVCASIVEGAGEALSAYPSSIDQDMSALRGGGLATRSRAEMAALVSLGEKQALDYVLRYFEERTANLKKLVYYQDRRLKRLGLIDDSGRTTYDSFFQDGIA